MYHQQKADIQRQIKAIDPSLDAMKLSEMNKELKSVSWMNSEEAAEAQFEKE